MNGSYLTSQIEERRFAGMIKDEMSNIDNANRPNKKLGMLHHDIVYKKDIKRVIRGRNRENSVGEL